MIHAKFICQPVIQILQNFANSVHSLHNEHNAYPLNEPLMASIFLQMTGMLEQKGKCIYWTIATVDFEYRQTNRTGLNTEYSCYKDKQCLYKDLTEQIGKFIKLDEAEIAKEKIEFLQQAFDTVKKVLQDSTFTKWNPRQFNMLDSMYKDFTADWSKDSLLSKSLKEAYEQLYRHRNRCAHNTRSYQPNLPTFLSLNTDTNKYNNYFLFFVILALIDEIYINMFTKYRKLLIKNHVIESD